MKRSEAKERFDDCIVEVEGRKLAVKPLVFKRFDHCGAVIAMMAIPSTTFKPPPSPPTFRGHLKRRTLCFSQRTSSLATLRSSAASLNGRKSYKGRAGADKKTTKFDVIGEVMRISGEGSSMQTEEATPRNRSEGPKKLHRTWIPGRSSSSAAGQLTYENATINAQVNSVTLDDKVVVGKNLHQFPHAPHIGIAARPRVKESVSDSEEEDVPMASTSDLNCEHFLRCSGCLFERELDKPHVLEDAKKFFKARGVHEFPFISKHLRGWRCRAKLAVRGTSHNPSIGLFEEETHEVVDIPSCQAHHPCINIAVELLKGAIRELGVQPYDELTHSGQLRYVQMIATTYDTSVPLRERYKNAKVHISLVWNSRDENSPNGILLQDLAKVIFGGRWRHIFGETELWEHLGGVDVCFIPSSFGQANLGAFHALLRSLQKFVHKGAAVVDLYAGVGVIGLSLAATRNCRVVKCVEVNKESKAPFELSLSRISKSVDCDLSWHCADVSVTPIKWLEGVEIVIADPPRKGLEASIIEALRLASMRLQGKTKCPPSNPIKKTEKRPWILHMMGGVRMERSFDVDDDNFTWPTKLIYISCGWQSFQEDCEALEKDNLWHLDSVQAFNFFPGTNSIEVLAVFKVGKKPKHSANKVAAKKKLKRKALS
ncbi:hypothetical protein O6H91_10G075800 [Diphasiastrum complanatum]|uniref:Uncharacterized protein n=1 Tax=Diphasiastrum complanatum TaxID=34168 RepID=A0ACC2CII8_DIPCM|nr:hypothetical protein O6H91_10G075800 [Diphasiastrum complanatum]